MGSVFRLAGAALALGFAVQGAQAQDTAVTLPTIDVGVTRLGGGGLAGTSTSIITSEEIARSARQTLTDILSEQAGVQIQHVGAGVNGARDVVDLRGFGASAPSNVLVLVNGRRFNDFDLQGFDYSSIPLNAIERIEVTRGNSGAVLYGDGAVGGVINIVTKNGANLPPAARVETAFGSFRYKEARASASGSSGPFSVALNTIGLTTDGYRDNSKLHQKGINGDVRYTTSEGSVYFNVIADDQKLGLPGGRLVDQTTGINQLVTDRTGATTPNDYSNKQGQNYTLGISRIVAPGIEAILDGSYRRKTQQAELFFNGSPFNGVDTRLRTASITPRLKIDTDMLGRPAKFTTGFDYYRTTFEQDRSQDFVSSPYHIYDIKQTTAGFYGNGTIALRPDTDVTAGVRYQQNTISARDTYDPNAPSGAGDAQGLPLDKSEWKYAAQGGLEHRITPDFVLFGHVAHSFRVPNADERVGQAVAFNFPAPTPTNFDLRTQTSNEIEGGFRATLGPLKWQTSAYDMRLHDEIFFSPATGTNVNLDPTHHYGVENTATLQVSDTVRLRGNLTYSRAVFTDGQFAANDIPLISKWTANAGLTWNVWDKFVVYDVTVRYAGPRRLDNDSANVQPLIPAHTTVDMRIGGEFKNAFWSLSIENLFNEMFYDYGIASTFTIGRFNAYPQPGRTVMGRIGFNLP
ncbi:MAG TPA: TonB-dependent receptor [Pseudolabrys sp.]|nr:TonB-dependent receptor [Pseudolabrys sp.]